MSDIRSDSEPGRSLTIVIRPYLDNAVLITLWPNELIDKLWNSV